MKKGLFLLLILGLCSVPSGASITVEETTDAEALINGGYSQALAEDVFVQKNRVTGQPVEPLYEKSQNKFVKLCRIIRSLHQTSRNHHLRLYLD